MRGAEPGEAGIQFFISIPVLLKVFYSECFFGVRKEKCFNNAVNCKLSTLQLNLCECHSPPNTGFRICVPINQTSHQYDSLSPPTNPLHPVRRLIPFWGKLE